MKKKKLVLLTAVTLVLGSCAKEKKYDTVYKVPELEAKSSFKTHKKVIQKDGTEKLEPIKYLYVPMTLGTPMQVREANPFYQGQEKIVRLKWAKEGLKVVEMELDERYADNDLNETPVLTIPGEYKAFRCKENSYGDCENAEEENTEVEWDGKKFFKPDYANVKVEEVNFLDLANVEGDSCITPNGVQVVDYEVSDGVINLELEKTYKLKNSWGCIRNNYFDDKLSYNGFKVRFFYSIVELDKLATPGYKAVEYPTNDHSIYGYFKNEKEKLEDNFDPSRKETVSLLNRWAPQRKNNELVYYLSKSFNKEKNKPLLDATLRATDIMNKGFAQANMPFKLKMVQQKDNEKAVSPGDLRYNTVVLIDDPLANGLLGYGPSVSNPLTGEIVQAHTNMYGGVLTSTVRRAYESAVDLSIDRKNKKKKTEKVQVTLAKDALKGLLPEVLTAPLVNSVNGQVAAINTAKAHEHIHHAVNNVEYLNVTDIAKRNLEHFVENSHKEAVNQKLAYKNLLESEFDGMGKLEKMAKEEEAKAHGHHLSTDHAPEFFEIGGTIKHIPEEIVAIEGIQNEDGTLKRWDALSKVQKDKVQEIILVHSYTATFIHEIGHNLGLRHNFSGSWDKDNFYTKEEAVALGMKEAPAYSSVMDYSFSEFNQLAALGKYDVAALRFAYAREILTKDGQVVPVNGSIFDLQQQARAAGVELQTYQFCTDENAGLSSTCNRFDEGTSLVEIANHKVKRYQDAYKYRNFRDGKKSFSSYGLPWYVISRYREFKGIRDIVEDYQSFVELLGPEIMAQGCSPAQAANPQNANICAMIKDRIDSATIIGKFFVDILKTPDLICAVAKKDAPTKIVSLEKLTETYDKIKYRINADIVKSCFDSEVKAFFDSEGLVVVGENGKFLNSVRGTDPKNKYASDRDIRGIWADKALAMRMLFDRVSGRGSNDTNQGALVDIPAVAEELGPLLSHLIIGSPLKDPHAFKTEDGKEFVIPYVLSSNDTVDQVERYFGWLKSEFNMPRNGKANFNEVILKQITSGNSLSLGDDVLDSAYALMNFATVRKSGTLTPLNREDENMIHYTVRDTIYSSSEENALAHHILTVLSKEKYMAKQPKELLAKVLKQRTAPEAPADLEADLKAFFNLNSATQEMLLNYAAQGAAIQEAQFINAFGEELGKLISSAYSKGPMVLMNIVVKKKEIMESIPAEITDKAEIENYKKLLKMDLEILNLFTTGRVTDELLKFYKGQLKRLPTHRQYYNI